MRILKILISIMLAMHTPFVQSAVAQQVIKSVPAEAIVFVPLTEQQKELIANLLRSAKDWALLRGEANLDGTEESVATLEAVLADTSSWLKTPGLDLVKQRTEGSCMAYGAYFGQLFVDQLGAELGTTRGILDGSDELTVRTKGSQVILIYPIRRVCSRLTEGVQYNVLDYYKAAMAAAKEKQ
jgi:hypothetical protein